MKAIADKMRLLSATQKENEWVFTVQTTTIYEQRLSGESFSCTCLDHQSKKTFCKHLLFLVARAACQMDLAANIVQKPKTGWKKTAYDACTASWINRLSHLMGKPATIPADKEGDCSICFETMKDGDLVSCETTCKNWFHGECLKHWLEHGSNTCPLCRSNWNEVKVEDVEEKIQGLILTESTEVETDLVISFDTTGSMYPCLAEVRRNVSTLVQKLFREIKGLRLAIIAHGDYCDKDKMISVLDFTQDQDALKRFIENAPATNGGDYPECYELVLQRTRELSWRADAKMKSLVLIGDAPPHGVNENPTKIDWRVEAEALANRNIQVFSVQCLNHGNRESYEFYAEVAKVTNGYHVFLDQFSYIKDMIQAICFRQYNKEHLEEFERDVQVATGGMNQTLRLMFDTMLGKKSREEVYKEMHPDRFRERYHRPSVSRSHHTEAAVPSLERVSELRPCHPSKFQVFNVEEDMPIQRFCSNMGIAFSKGKGFYEFTKNEIIQPQKEIVLMDRSTGELYEGDVARTIAGIKSNEERAKIKPANLDKYRVFVQSTSPNRKLIKDQGFLYEVSV